LTFHVRDRGPGGVLLDVFVSDTRDPQSEMTYLGSSGLIAKTGAGTFLVLEDGQIIRKPTGGGYASIVVFESYAFSLSALADATPTVNFSAQERSTWELFRLLGTPQSDRRFEGRVRSEFNDRFATPLYVLAFALVAFALLGRARTTRQSRTESVVVAIAVVVALRIGGFFASGLAQREAWAVVLIYAVPLLGIAAALAVSFGSTWLMRLLPVRAKVPPSGPSLARLGSG
jgi:lipopolysaccharide export system permease protein